MEYDKKMIEEYGVLFNMSVVKKILKAYNKYQSNSSLSVAGDPSSFLKTVGPSSVACVYDKKGYGPKWFYTRLERTPASRQRFPKANDVCWLPWSEWSSSFEAAPRLTPHSNGSSAVFLGACSLVPAFARRKAPTRG